MFHTLPQHISAYDYLSTYGSQICMLTVQSDLDILYQDQIALPLKIRASVDANQPNSTEINRGTLVYRWFKVSGHIGILIHILVILTILHDWIIKNALKELHNVLNARLWRLFIAIYLLRSWADKALMDSLDFFSMYVSPFNKAFYYVPILLA